MDDTAHNWNLNTRREYDLAYVPEIPGGGDEGEWERARRGVAELIEEMEQRAREAIDRS